ncbi:hypothetical protein [Amycolatopsis samaneae]|uniref:Lipoprotein n=1 Tax=Amycolatopsis samaneae TaxID=664691 RepID=A0ABW5GNB3_9PSEU
MVNTCFEGLSMGSNAKTIRRGATAIAAVAAIGALGACSNAGQQPAAGGAAAAPVTQALTTVPAPKISDTRSTPPVAGTGSATAPRPAATDASLLGPGGYGALKLGMSRSAALATGLLSPAKPGAASGCTGHDVVGHATGADSVGVYVSPTRGVAHISAVPGWHTPEHIGLGATKAQVTAAYPKLEVGINGAHTLVPGNVQAVYRFELDQAGKVTSLALELAEQDCAN